MAYDDTTDESAVTEAASPLPNRFTRSTAMGCLGISCVLALPVLLYVPFLDLGGPVWVRIVAPFVACMLVAIGIVVLARVPSGTRVTSYDPEHPLTGAGTSPIVETPAVAANRIAAGGAALLLLGVLAGVIVAATSNAELPSLGTGLLVSGVLGLVLIADGLLVLAGQLPAPALRWVRTPIQSWWAPQGAALLLAGLATVFWALLILALAGFALGSIGVALLIVLLVVTTPLARRISTQNRRWPRPSDASQFRAGEC